jgi:hypothetical protein
MKTEVYSWRVSAEKKAELEEEARRQRTSLAHLLDQITTNWLSGRRNGRDGDEAEQAAIMRRVMTTVGTIRSGDPALSTRVREVVRERIVRKHAKESNASRRLN